MCGARSHANTAQTFCVCDDDEHHEWIEETNVCKCRPQFYNQSDVCLTCVVGASVTLAQDGCECYGDNVEWMRTCNTCECIAGSFNNSGECEICNAISKVNDIQTVCDCNWDNSVWDLLENNCSC